VILVGVFADDGAPAVVVATPFPFVRVVEIITEAAPVAAPAVVVAASGVFEVVTRLENTPNTPTSV
jgi:hypothetical protein